MCGMEKSNHVLRLRSCVAVGIACLALSMSPQAFGGLTDVAWVEDNPEGVAVALQIWPSGGGGQDLNLDPVFGPLVSPSGMWEFTSFMVAETPSDPFNLQAVQVDGILSRVGAHVPGPGEIPFSFGSDTSVPGIFDGPVFYPMSSLPPDVLNLTFAARMGTDAKGTIYGIGMGAGIPEPAEGPMEMPLGMCPHGEWCNPCCCRAQARFQKRVPRKERLRGPREDCHGATWLDDSSKLPNAGERLYGGGVSHAAGAPHPVEGLVVEGEIRGIALKIGHAPR